SSFENNVTIQKILMVLKTAFILIIQNAFHYFLKFAVSRPSPPASVSIQCDSYGVEVRWEYPDLFLCSLRGGEESEPTRSDIFSYNKYATAKIKCHLDFPEVELSPKDGKLHVQFTNPLQLYRNSPALRGLNDNLKYCIETEEGRNEACETCEMKQNTCETSVVFSEHRGEYCVNLTGKIGQRFFKLRSSCFTGDIRSYPPVTMYVYPVLGVVLTLLFITGIIMLLVTKCNSEMKEKSPSVFKTHDDECRTLKVEPEPISVVKIEPAEDNKEQAPLLKMSDEERPSDTKDLGSGDSEVKSPYGPNDLVESEQSNQSGFYDSLSLSNSGVHRFVNFVVYYFKSFGTR
uniref:Uncharacterized protein n=1 Tax=Sinocyclocheilus rhinocerous TaxID=307959 RepID=A0A673K3S5_9TELE